MVAPSQPTVQSESYETDLTDEQWEQIRPFVEVHAKTGPKRRVDLRAVLNGLLYKLKAGCQWELLPRSFPPKSTVHYYFQQWTKKGIWVAINDALRRRVRVEVEGRTHVEPTGGVIDTQSAKSSVAGGPERGFDGGKKVYGRKRHLLTDTLGLLVTAVVHSARLYNGAGARQVFAAPKERGISLLKVWADQTYRGELGAWMADNGMGELEIVERLPGQRGFQVQPKRWVVEGAFAMATPAALSRAAIKHPIDISSRAFIEHKDAYYRWLREEAPVYKGKLSIINVYLLSRYDDCVAMLKDPRFVRDRTTVTGGKNRLPIPVPKAISLVAKNMILEDEPEHRRLRNLVHKAFTPRALARLEGRIERLTHELLDAVEGRGTLDLMQAYALPIPVTVIQELVGVSDADMPRFRSGIRVLSEGFSGWSFLRTIVWDLPATVRFVRELIARKRANPGDDILTGLVQAEEAGQQLSDDELVSMVMLLILAGYETTVHLITNSVASLLLHPEELARLRAQPELVGSAVEEVLRYNGPVQSTKPAYAREDVTLHGVTIPKGAMAMPLVGAANHDPAIFERPEVFDIGRTPNRHLGFGQGIHYCLGAPLARMETRIALTTLLERSPNLRLAVEPRELTLQPLPSWHRYTALPVVLG